MVDKAESYHHELFMHYEYCSKPPQEKLSAFFKNAIPELEKYYRLTKSPLVCYYLFFLKMSLCMNSCDYTKARKICFKLLHIIHTHKSVYQRQRLGEVFNNISRASLAMGYYKQAVTYARGAQKHVSHSITHYYSALEHEFYGLCAMKKYSHPTEITSKVFTGTYEKELGKFRCSKSNYFLANVLFKQRQFNKTLNILSQKREICRDKSGWETGARILTIMTFIELNEDHKAALAIHNLKQFFRRIDKKYPIRIRDKKILNLLSSGFEKN